MKEDLTWKKQLAKVLDDNYRDNLFGKNVEWHIKDVIKFFSKLEKLGVSDIKIIDYETIDFELPAPVDCHDVFLHILTMSPKPSDVIHKKRKYNNRLILEWRY